MTGRRRAQRALAVVCTAVAIAFTRPATANEPADAENEDRTQEFQENVGVATLGGGAAMVDAPGAYKASPTGGSWALEFAGKGRHWPVMLGLNLGTSFFDAERAGNPYTTLELRKYELVTRFQPFWETVRPYVQASIGVVHMSYTKGFLSWGEDAGASSAAVFGLALGVDWRLFSLSPQPAGTYAVVLSTGLKRFFTTHGVNPATHEREALAMWMPFVAVGISFDGRVEKRGTAPPPRREPEPVTIDVDGVKEAEPGPRRR